MRCPLRIERWGIVPKARLRHDGRKIGLDHAGDDGARLREIQRSNGRVHSVEVLAAA
jgi:hypothetical protein